MPGLHEIVLGVVLGWLLGTGVGNAWNWLQRHNAKTEEKHVPRD